MLLVLSIMSVSKLIPVLTISFRRFKPNIPINVWLQLHLSGLNPNIPNNVWLQLHLSGLKPNIPNNVCWQFHVLSHKHIYRIRSACSFMFYLTKTLIFSSLPSRVEQELENSVRVKGLLTGFLCECFGTVVCTISTARDKHKSYRWDIEKVLYLSRKWRACTRS